MRCPHCGTNCPDADVPCAGCGATLVAIQERAPQQPWEPFQTSWSAPAVYESQPMTAEGGHELTAASAEPVIGTRQNGDLCGHVLVVEQGHPEPPPFNLCRLLSGLVWLLVFVLAPFAIFFAVLQAAGGLSVLVFLAVTFFGARFALSWLMPHNLLSLLELRMLLNPSSRRQQQDVPVYFIRVRTHDGDEAEVRLQGRLTRGNVRMDDWMTFWGRWRGGVLDARRGWNHRTGSWIEIHSTQSWLSLAFALAVLVVVLASLSHTIAPRSQEEPPRVFGSW